MEDGIANEAFHCDSEVEQAEQLPKKKHIVDTKLKDFDGSYEDTLDSTNALSYVQLFRYASNFERRLVVAGILFSTAAGLCFPFFLLLYSEFMSLLVDRDMEGITSSFSPIHSWYGGGRILKNGTHEERMVALLEDSAAFGINGLTISIAEFVLGIAAVTCMNHAATSQVSRVRMMFVKALLCQEMSWHDTHGTANVATGLADDLEKLQEGIGDSVAVVVFLVVSTLSSVIVALIKGWKLALVILSFAPIIIFAQAFAAKMQESLAAKECKHYGAGNAIVEEVLSSIRTVMAFGGEKKEMKRYQDTLDKPTRMGIKLGMYIGLSAGVTWLIVFISRGTTFWYGVQLILEDRYKDSEDRMYTPGIILVVLYGILANSMTLALAAPRFESINVALGAAKAVFDVIERASTINCFSRDGHQENKLLGDIEFVDVHFQYPTRPEAPVLQGMNLQIPRGQTVAIVGHSGSGKSTLVQLVQRLYDPVQGKVLLDGMDVRGLNVGWFRCQIGVVSQEPVLFNLTIEENIRVGMPNATDGEVRQAAIDATAHDFITTLPQGYQTMVGERGAQLSGGQKQRIAIARALVRRPAILLLDEATSALDRASEAQVQSALDAASRGRTTIIVAHRLSTVRAADRIVVLSEGRLVEQGTHDELMEAGGHYHSLVAADASATDKCLPMVVESFDKAPERPTNTIVPKSSATVKDVEETCFSSSEAYPASMRRIVSLNAPDWAYILAGCISAMVVGACIPAHVMLIGTMYGVLSIDSSEEVNMASNFFSILFVVVGIFTGLGTFLQSYTFTVAGVRLTNRLRTSAFAAILRQEVGWFDDERNSVGALCSRLAGASSVQGVTRSIFAVTFQSATTLIIGVVISFYFSWKLTLACIISIPITLCSVILEHKIIKSHAIAEKCALEVATQVAVEAVSNLRTVAGLGAEQAILHRYQRQLDKAITAGRRKTRVRGLAFAWVQAMPHLCYVPCFWYGGYLVVNEGLPYQNLIKIGDLLIFGVWILGQSLAHATNFTAAKLAAGRIFRVLDRAPLVKESSDCVAPKGDIKYSNVEFAYPSRPEVKILRGLDLLVRPGQTVALVGASGCGKSTCIQLLQRFYDPDAGQIHLGEQAIDVVPRRQLRRELGVVSQEPVLFDRTIAENIAYGDNEREHDISEIINVAIKANIHSFVKSLSLGYDTRLGSKGTQLSGGQKQRIAIARALLRNPRLLVLDEATSALDSQSEKVVQAALEQAREGRTCITIAHRLATIQNADLICVLDRGMVAEAGTHSELMQLGGVYQRLHHQVVAL